MAPYFDSNEKKEIKDALYENKETECLHFEIENFKNIKTISEFMNSGGKFSDILKCIKENTLRIDFGPGENGENNIISNIISKADNRKKFQEIIKDKINAEKAIERALIKIDDKNAKEAYKNTMKQFGKIESDMRKNKKKHQNAMKKIVKSINKINNEVKQKKAVDKEYQKALKQEQKEIEKAKKLAEKEAKKEAKKAEKEAKKEAKKAEKEAKKAEKETKKAEKKNKKL